MLFVKVAIFSVLLFVHFRNLNADCIQKKLCSACIQEPGCGWCEIAQKLEAYRKASFRKPDQMLDLTLARLKGEAKQWSVLYKGSWKTYDDFKAALLRTYWNTKKQREVRYKISHDRYEPTKGDSLFGHLAKQVELASLLTPAIPPDELLANLVQHYPEDIQNLWMVKGSQTVIEFGEFLRQYQDTSSYTFREVHCLNETSELAKNCSGFYTITSSKADMNDEPLSSNIHVKPQKIVVNLRKNQKYKFNFLYQQASDYPVDLYFIMDMSNSMRKVKKTIGNLGKSILEKLNKLTKNSRIGFGSFIDKACLPFQNTGNNTIKENTYSFKNNIALTNNSEKFKKAVEDALTLPNLDCPESGFDALMQAMVCKKEINWREDSRHIIILATDAASHMAGKTYTFLRKHFIKKVPGGFLTKKPA
ncbi:unnamed protein product [Brassicogethes aeneus]|uniref:Integrin beta subunit VWA domain-containing protein n=1 Tax=Brassicogethes aeneus TaxID=1431903 RepID=A0A9P0FDU1_BRAAE|nr:unnamed protein product [Brassicogethes aeneus]